MQALGATEGRCLRVSDGDTITIAAEGRKEKVRLIGIDAPELRQEGGPEARQYLEKRILNRRVKVEGETRDRYGRLLGTVYLGEENINLSLVREGHAWDYKAYSAGPAYTRAERAARAARRGLWAQQNAVAPWNYRKAERSARRSATPAPRPEAATALYWVSNSGKTHNRSCRHFRDNPGSGYYTNTPSPAMPNAAAELDAAGRVDEGGGIASVSGSHVSDPKMQGKSARTTHEFHLVCFSFLFS